MDFFETLPHLALCWMVVGFFWFVFWVASLLICLQWWVAEYRLIDALGPFHNKSHKNSLSCSFIVLPVNPMWEDWELFTFWLVMVLFRDTHRFLLCLTSLTFWSSSHFVGFEKLVMDLWLWTCEVVMRCLALRRVFICPKDLSFGSLYLVTYEFLLGQVLEDECSYNNN